MKRIVFVAVAALLPTAVCAQAPTRADVDVAARQVNLVVGWADELARQAGRPPR